MTARTVSPPTTSWDIRLTCDGKACGRSVKVTVHAISQIGALERARDNLRKNDGWTAEKKDVGEGRGRGFNIVDLCRRCANQKAGWQ